MRDPFPLRVVKRVALAFFVVDTFLQRAYRRLRGRAPFVLAGSCEGCGDCCVAPAIHTGFFVWYIPTLRRAFLAWQRRVNGFVVTGEDFRTRTVTFACTHFDRTTRRCDSYDSRPGMCRDYPRLHLYEASPEFMPRCGYRPIARDARRFLKVIDAQPLTPEQRAKVKARLFLE